MKKLITILIIILLPAVGWTTDYFVAQSDGPGSPADGSTYAKRMRIVDYNAGHLDASTDPGDTVYLCGTITTGLNTTEGGSGGTYLIFNGKCSDEGGTDVDLEVGSSSIAIKIDVDYTRWTWIQTSSVTGQGMQTTYTAGVNYLQIRNSYFTSTTAGAGGVFIDGASNVTIGGSESYSNLFENIGTTNTAAEDIALRGQGATQANDILISYNELKGNGTSRGADGIMCNDDGSDDVGDPGKEIIIEYNYIHDHWKENEIDLKGGGYFIIRKNIIDGSPDSYDQDAAIVIFHSGTDHNWFYGNIVRNFSKSGVLARDSLNDAQGVNNIFYWSNLIYNIGWDGMVFNPTSYQDTVDVKVWNNTIVDNNNAPDNSSQAGLRWKWTWVNADDYYQYNNIIAFNRDGQGSRPAQQLWTAGTTNFISDYNLYWTADNSNEVTVYYNAAERDFDDVWVVAGHDTNGTEADPGFTDRDSDNYTTASNLTGTESGETLRGWHADADKGLDEDSNLNAEQCGNTPGGYAQCAKGLILADRDEFNGGTWGKGAFVYGSTISPPIQGVKIQ
jgi:hypothetical protein